MMGRHRPFPAEARQVARAALLSLPVAAVPVPLYDLVLFDKHDGEEREDWCGLLRDAFGPLPFRPPLLAPDVLAWQDATVIRLARTAYEGRELTSAWLDRARLAVLADALERAGADAELVAHLSEPGPHVRGCWGWVDLRAVPGRAPQPTWAARRHNAIIVA